MCHVGHRALSTLLLTQILFTTPSPRFILSTSISETIHRFWFLVYFICRWLWITHYRRWNCTSFHLPSIPSWRRIPFSTLVILKTLPFSRSWDLCYTHVHKCFILLRTQRCSKKSLERCTQRVALSTTLTNFDAILGVVVVGCKHACILDLRCERCLGFQKTACIVMNVTKFNKVFILLRLFCVILFLVQVSLNRSATYFKPKGE